MSKQNQGIEPSTQGLYLCFLPITNSRNVSKTGFVSNFTAFFSEFSV